MFVLLYVLIPIAVVVLIGVVSSLYNSRPVSMEESIKSFDSARHALTRNHGASGTRRSSKKLRSRA